MALGIQDIFELKCLIQNIDIKLCARIESEDKQLLAIVTKNKDVILHYSYGELPIVVRRIQWFATNNKNIQAICFDPTATWLLIICCDSSLHIIPFLSLVDRKQKVDCKWSISDLTHFFKPPQSPDCKPTSLVWWQTLDCNQNALIGYENGVIALISLTDGRFISTCTVNETITELNLRHDNNLDACFLLINGISGQQWKLVLEQYPIGYIWPPELVNQSDDNVPNRSHSWRQMGVDILISLMQRLVEKKNSKRDSASDTTSEASFLSDCSHTGPELLPQFSDTFFSTQFVGDRHLFSAFYKPANVLTVHIVNSESEPLCKYKLPPDTCEPLLNGKLIFTVNDDKNLIQIVSSHLSDCKKDEDEFNPDSLIAQFSFKNEKILKVYRLTDFAAAKIKKNNEDKLFEMPKSIDDLHLKRTRVDTCIIVTMTAVYKIHIRIAPVKRFIHYIIDESDYERAEKVAHIFGLNTHQLLENCGDLFVSRASYHSGIILYKQARTHLLKRVLKLALAADCKTLLKFINLCLNAGKVDMSVATKIHTGNLALMAYTELILRYGNSARMSNIQDFMRFLRYEELYDQILAVNVACQAAQWKIVNVLAKTRGLLPEAVAAFGQILQSARAPRPTDLDFVYCISEPSLTQSLLLAPKSAEVIFKYIRTNVKIFPDDILRRFLLQLDPSQPSAIPLVSKLSRYQRKQSNAESISDSSELDNFSGDLSVVRNLIETFIVVLVHLVSTTQCNFSLKYLKRVKGPDQIHQEQLLDHFPDFQVLSCGYDHAAVVRNDMAFTMGVSNLGCLGVGPVLSQSSPPRLVSTLANLRVKVISVSCGRKHTLFLTDYGVYSCGSNNYSQLGLGPNIQESPYPQMITDLSSVKIMQVVCGQYHSLALTAEGHVYTWGWGIHGQLGHGSCNNEVYPRKLNFTKKIKQLAAGHAHSLILTEEGELYGFGSNAFGQLESSHEDKNKYTKPIRIHIKSNLLVPVEKVTSAYFHNVAVVQGQEVYTWGASPQEVRLIQSKHLKKGNGTSVKMPECWKDAANIFSGSDGAPIQQISVGYRHTAILHQGRILWGRNKDDELSPPHLQEQDISVNIHNYRFLHVSCGLDYTMAVDRMGRLLAWGSISMAQTLLGRSLNDSSEGKSNDCFLSANGGRRIFKVPSNVQGSSDLLPIEVPRIPSVTITFNPTDHNTILSKKFIPYSIIKIENIDACIGKVTESDIPFKDIHFSPKYNLGQKTLQYVLETYYGLYDFDNILQVCLHEENYLAASRIAFIGGQYCDSLSFQLKAFKIHMDSYKSELEFFAKEYEVFSQNEHQKNFIESLKKVNTVNEKSDISQSNSFEHSSDTPIQLSSSSSLDSIRLWEEQEHQGGCESPCQTEDINDRYSLSQLVQSLRNNHINQPFSSVSKMLCENDNDEKEFEISNINVKNIVQIACHIVEFYLERISSTDNPILMQNILMLVIDFWLSSSLPVQILEKVLLKNIEKYFYPLSVILFCKNFSNDSASDQNPTEENKPKNSASFLKEFSTKFCLQLCLMVVENVNKT